MSLDQLPNELISHIGSFLNFDDNRQFGLSQKRIRNVLRRDGLDKPMCYLATFANLAEVNCVFSLSKFDIGIFVKEEQDIQFSSPSGQIFDKFRKVEVLLLHDYTEVMNENVFMDIVKTKTKFSSLEIYVDKISNVDTNIFVAACKKFDKIYLHSNEMSSELCTDKIFVELMPTTHFYLFNIPRNVPTNGFALTDKTLNSVATYAAKNGFMISNMFTSFTISGVKRLVENLTQSHQKHGYHNLGILKFEEEENAFRWFSEAANHPNWAYTIRRDETRPQMMQYNINLKVCSLSHKACVVFLINLREA